MNRSVFFAAALGLTAASANAQVVYGTDDATDSDNFRLDQGSGVSTGPVWTGAGVYGIAADDTNNVMYVNDSAVLYSWAYGDSNPATNLGNLVNAGTTTSNSQLGLAFNAGTLYSVDSATPDEISTIDLVTLELTSVYVFTNNSGFPGGLAADPTTGLLYYSQDSTSSSWMDSFGNTGPGTVEVDLVAGTELHILGYPGTLAGSNDVDGLALDPAGRIYLIEDQTAPLHNFDLATLTYDPAPPMNAIAASEVFSGGGFTPANLDTSIGTNYCMAAVNSTGSAAVMAASGSIAVADNSFSLHCSGMPPMAFGYFLNSQTQGFAMMPGGSSGNLCLAGSVGRFDQQIQNSGMTGEISILTDLTAFPQPTGAVSVAAGETWNFTCWFRDMAPTGGATSNFADGLEVTFN